MSLGGDEARAALQAFFRDELRAAEAGAPGPEELAAYVDGTLDAAEREALELALADDPALRQEVADLVALRAALAQPRRRVAASVPLGLALAACLAGGVGLLLWSRSERALPAVQQAARTSPSLPAPLISLRDAGGPLSLFEDGSLRGRSVDALPVELRRRVAAALRRGDVELPAGISALRGTRLTLMGSANASDAFALVAPLASAVRAERPSFTWRPHPQARAYEVSIYDEDLNPRARSGELRATTWTSTVALPRGRAFVWQVAALTPAGRVVAPRPPLPEARFVILSASDEAALAARLEGARGSHLAAGVLLAEAGVLDEAERELRALSAVNPGDAGVERLLAGLR